MFRSVVTASQHRSEPTTYTFTPRVMSKRGILLGNEFRLKQEAFEGELFG